MIFKFWLYIHKNLQHFKLSIAGWLPLRVNPFFSNLEITSPIWEAQKSIGISRKSKSVIIRLKHKNPRLGLKVHYLVKQFNPLWSNLSLSSQQRGTQSKLNKKKFIAQRNQGQGKKEERLTSPLWTPSGLIIMKVCSISLSWVFFLFCCSERAKTMSDGVRKMWRALYVAIEKQTLVGREYSVKKYLFRSFLWN